MRGLIVHTFALQGRDPRAGGSPCYIGRTIDKARKRKLWVLGDGHNKNWKMVVLLVGLEVLLRPKYALGLPTPDWTRL
jgi:hypothetical protein